MTNMDVLTIPAVGGVDSTALIVGDFSNGNDGIVTKSGKTVKDLKGQKIKLVQLSVSHYLLSRALAMNGMTEKDVTLVNTSDADIGSLFLAEKTGAAVTWNPILHQGAQRQGRRHGFRFVEDSGRDHRHDGGAHRRARCAQEGAGRRVVRNHGRHVRRRQAGEGGDRVHGGQGRRHGGGVRGPAQGDLDVLQARRGRCVREEPQAQGDDGVRAHVLVREGAVRARAPAPRMPSGIAFPDGSTIGNRRT